jgi:hypothetical protein
MEKARKAEIENVLGELVSANRELEKRFKNYRWKYNYLKEAVKSGEIKTLSAVLKSPYFPDSIVHKVKAMVYLYVHKFRMTFLVRQD